MDKEIKEKIKFTTKEVLLCFCDVLVNLQEIFGYRMYRDLTKEYWRWRNENKLKSARLLWRLEKQGYIKRYNEGKHNLIRLTPVGERQAIKYLSHNIEIPDHVSWDKKWRMVIFDIPKDKKVLRDIVREHLKNWGFYQLQKSVFIYPFDCQKEISALQYLYKLDKYVKFIVAESLDVELDLIEIFYNQGIITKAHLV